MDKVTAPTIHDTPGGLWSREDLKQVLSDIGTDIDTNTSTANYRRAGGAGPAHQVPWACCGVPHG